MKIAISDNSYKDKVNARAWGDYWVNHHLANAFRELGHEIVDDDCDLLFELFGGPVNLVKNYKIRTCWFYSHPEMMSLEVAGSYDIVFTKSKAWAEVLGEELRSVVHLIGCGHCVLPPGDRSIIHDIVFVANAKVPGSRYGRRIIDDLDPESNGFNLELYGLKWQHYPSARPYHKGPEWPNLELNELYGRAKITLADCHPLMAEQGFVPQRIYDAVRSGGLCISSHIVDLRTIFKEVVVTYKSPEDLQDKVRYYLNNEKARQKKIEKGLELTKEHTYLNRAKRILQEVNGLWK